MTPLPATNLKRRATDVNSLTFGVKDVVQIVGTIVAIVATQYMTLSGIRDSQNAMQSEIRNIVTRLEYTAKLDEANQRGREDRDKAMQETIASMGRRLELVQMQYQQLRELVLERKP